jgi:hypothetical protein
MKVMKKANNIEGFKVIKEGCVCSSHVNSIVQ